jgi:hypothetical protein
VCHQRQPHPVSVAHSTAPPCLATLRAFFHKIKNNLTRTAFEELSGAYDSITNDSWDTVCSRVAAMSGVKPAVYDCCSNSCCLFAGPHADLDHCPYCKNPRRFSDGTPRKRFSFPRLSAFFGIPKLVKLMSCRTDVTKENDEAADASYFDTFSGSHPRELLSKPVTVNGQTLDHNYFNDPRDRCRRST